ncbi:unnamed protein product [Protopolystoma xenopodis]|uniref:Uncharacterized protein n=1 Tax=Protopolystoma xenopodis TaxID=117903 RepID=A0A448WIV2_9PLAT|nr:unnamed protein product [Protopolystoma xenopodis]
MPGNPYIHSQPTHAQRLRPHLPSHLGAKVVSFLEAWQRLAGLLDFTLPPSVARVINTSHASGHTLALRQNDTNEHQNEDQQVTGNMHLPVSTSATVVRMQNDISGLSRWLATVARFLATSQVTLGDKFDSEIVSAQLQVSIHLTWPTKRLSAFYGFCPDACVEACNFLGLDVW